VVGVGEGDGDGVEVGVWGRGWKGVRVIVIDRRGASVSGLVIGDSLPQPVKNRNSIKTTDAISFSGIAFA
jgi:hypothetical protein